MPNDKLVTTPHGMLKLFRQNMEGFDADQVRQFNLMPAGEKMELLFGIKCTKAARPVKTWC